MTKTHESFLARLISLICSHHASHHASQFQLKAIARWICWKLKCFHFVVIKRIWLSTCIPIPDESSAYLHMSTIKRKGYTGCRRLYVAHFLWFKKKITSDSIFKIHFTHQYVDGRYYDKRVIDVKSFDNMRYICNWKTYQAYYRQW